MGKHFNLKATLQHINTNGEVVWTSEAFTVNATNWTSLEIDISQTTVDFDGTWQLYYQSAPLMRQNGSLSQLIQQS